MSSGRVNALVDVCMRRPSIFAQLSPTLTSPFVVITPARLADRSLSLFSSPTPPSLPPCFHTRHTPSSHTTKAMPARKTYFIAGLLFFLVVIVSRRGSNTTPNNDGNEIDRSQRVPVKQPNDGGGGNYQPDPYKQPMGPPSSSRPETPNNSKQYDTLVVIPSSWTQMQSRRWVRDTIFGIKNNLEPCKKHDGRIIYKFYVHGRTTWLKSGIHSAQFMQAQVRDLYAEFMEFNDWEFTNTTVTDRYTVWGDALDWAVRGNLLSPSCCH